LIERDHQAISETITLWQPGKLNMKMLRLAEVETTGLSRATTYRHEIHGDFPQEHLADAPFTVS
jgi:hypothetical protein